ncbi:MULTISPECIES: hypothetical protein [Aliivibrio]|uniref:Uncharacterized protein n=1 Tax=Aliivibrio finisterrensis TaxID=511998 RepID=A0A4Q5KVD8_9GAMM|nr:MULTISPECIES: hypothetical protein [Aliivibrio]MDD9178720.1 hypothetical protein [Aliivibrio sp. A6]RYU52445.1 hypothetical protein ERW57_06560 [Aliivibrio finisterrensis]RYU55159.1 hypothetical protein ERW56_05025 [Aliivibrio finisterrensis]RYU59818.1 hypothetical protein ERW50_05040 [Aliivibrio finisterrensis]RYU65684.1 hypothetical protein ERW53_05635 [Aliivibrio finisterrensis]
MAVEKLTGPRLFQLIFLLVVLITAFTWRTITYKDPMDSVKNDQDATVCNITEKSCAFNIDNNQVIIDVKERPILQNTEVSILVSGLSEAWEMEATGVKMNMGTLKFMPSVKQNDKQMYSVFVPKCKHNDMAWNVEVSNSSQKINVIFNSTK